MTVESETRIGALQALVCLAVAELDEGGRRALAAGIGDLRDGPAVFMELQEALRPRDDTQAPA